MKLSELINQIPTLRFASDDLDREYVIYNNRQSARQAFHGFIFGSVGYGLYGAMLAVASQDYFADIALFLYAFVLPTHLAAAFFVRRMGQVYLLQWYLIGANIFSGTCATWLVMQGPNDFVIKFGYGLLLSINMYAYTILRMRFFFASVSTMLVLSGYGLALYYIHQPAWDDLLFTGGLVTFISACGLISTWFFESYTRQEFLQARTIEQQGRQLAAEKQKSEELLLNILPQEVAKRLLAGEQNIADLYQNVSVLFADIEGFTGLSRRLTPERLVELLNLIFTRFDEAAEKHGLEKIKTIGDSNMAAAGLPLPKEDHAARCVGLAEDMLHIMNEINRSLEEPLKLRIGIASGPVVAGVIGRNKFIFDLWGDTVNTASRMESSGLPGAVHITETTRRALNDRWAVSERGEIEVKGLGTMSTYLVKVG